MDKRQIVKMALDFKPVPYVPWNCGFTTEALETLRQHYACGDIDVVVDNHMVNLVDFNSVCRSLGNNQYQDHFGVIWDRSKDKDIGIVKECLLPEPKLDDYQFPDPCENTIFDKMDQKLLKYPNCFRVFNIDFSLYERAWMLRGMENLMMDFILNPDFLRNFFGLIADYNITQINKALEYDIDAVYFGDDWGQQTGLQMGIHLWREFIKPHLKRMYSAVRCAGKFVMIHSCGKVDSLFEDLAEIGVNCFNPFQPEVMNVSEMMTTYRGRLAFCGGLSTQKTLPYESAEQVRKETQYLLELGRKGGYIFAPAHAVEGDVPLENMLMFIEILQHQKNYERQ